MSRIARPIRHLSSTIYPDPMRGKPVTIVGILLMLSGTLVVGTLFSGLSSAAIAIGAGGIGGGAHTTQECYRPEGRDLGLKRILLTLLLLMRGGNPA